MNAMDSTTNEPISESNKNYKLVNDIPNELKFSSNRNTSGEKSKPIPIISEDVRKLKKR